MDIATFHASRRRFADVRSGRMGLEDIFFDRKWAYWLKDTIPSAERVVEVPDGRLFFPEDRPESLTEPMLRFWGKMVAD